MIFKLFGVNVYVSPLFFLIVTAVLLIDGSGTAVPVFCAVFIHEAGHLFVMNMLDNNIKSIRLIPGAVLIEGDAIIKFNHDLFISLAGILSNIIFSILFILITCFFQLSMYFAAANIVVAVINLYPVKGLDGGKILSLLLERYAGKSAVCFKIISLVFAILFLCFSVYAALSGAVNFTMLFFAVYIIVCSLLKI